MPKINKEMCRVNLRDDPRPEVGVAMTKDVGQLNLRHEVEELAARESCSQERCRQRRMLSSQNGHIDRESSTGSQQKSDV